MARERKSAEQLARIIAERIGIHGVEVRIRQDHADGWCPTIVSAPSNELGFQRRAEEIARRLRLEFDLAS
jgi:hypothetical protein